MLIAVTGSFGAGKTLSLTYFALQNFNKGRDIYSNYKLYKPLEYYYLEKPEEIEIMKDGVGLLDEFWFWFDSRCARKKRNRVLSYMIANFRKRGLDCFYSVQDLGQIDIRLRNWTDAVVVCKGSKLEFSDEFNDYSPTEMRLFFYTKSGYLQNRAFKIIKFKTKPLWKLYDTAEEICMVKD